MFLNVPQDEKRRKKWFQAVLRDNPKTKSNFFCCEDHFDNRPGDFRTNYRQETRSANKGSTNAGRDGAKRSATSTARARSCVGSRAQRSSTSPKSPFRTDPTKSHLSSYCHFNLAVDFIMELEGG
ncbi:hypothetical protein EVAR_31060_1 [Eumeta japonica]|uniref:THAP-type domain-containing protein n=1 Tax=Eumeta variegata TaxID=151549 RepID=A0A4C1VFI1_EUMVA|nr:hypothetical protein EVAR_31060_1 [Eumeta japonica]